MMLFSPFSLGCRAPQAEATGSGLVPIRLAPFDSVALASLQTLYARLLAPAPAPDLVTTLSDGARGHGQQAVIAWRGDQPVGCAGWVSFGIPTDGQCFGAPVLADDPAVARALIDHLVAEARRLEATSLRISAWAGETTKAAALQATGFAHRFDWVHFALATEGAAAVDFTAAGWRVVPFSEFEWPRLAALYAATFREVPNAPQPDLATLQAEWSAADWDAGCLLADAAGHYRAFSLIEEGCTVGAVGVDASLRGQGVAALLYQHARQRLAARGIPELKALVASSNTASMRLHQKLGFAEVLPRGAVFELAL